jgi:hypothetical protein
MNLIHLNEYSIKKNNKLKEIENGEH